ncbi:hypothetical protein SK128_008456 [Halocaridina rubra]|uniref:Uncharacterized protein n=1 Tax=Halocaridina rubra TaxID=373956 RepID=A0AAN8ZUR9_HALRR
MALFFYPLICISQPFPSSSLSRELVNDDDTLSVAELCHLTPFASILRLFWHCQVQGQLGIVLLKPINVIVKDTFLSAHDNHAVLSVVDVAKDVRSQGPHGVELK